MNDAQAAQTLQRILGKGWQVEPIAAVAQPDFATQDDLAYRAMMFRATTYKDPAAHARKMSRRFGAGAWEAYCKAADATKGQGTCLAHWQELIDATASAALGWTTCQQQRTESLAAWKARHIRN